jgi:hypothetical protein
MGDGKGVYRVSMGRPEGKRPLGRPRLRWDGNIKMELQEIDGWLALSGFVWLRIGTDGGRMRMR